MNQVATISNNQISIAEKEEFELIEQVVMQGDLSKLNPKQRVMYYNKVCESTGLNPLTRPFDYITLNGKLTLYARKDATEQLRQLKGISITKLEARVVEDLYIVTATAVTSDGRQDQATGAVCIGNLKGEQRANGIMKAETKAKRRVTLSIAGMGFTDESEVDTIPGAQKMAVDMQTGELTGNVKQIDIKPEAAQLISLPQKAYIEDMFDKCSPGYKKGFMDWLNKKGAPSIEQMPMSLYDEVKTKMEAHLSKMGESSIMEE
jgi:hypothetical protein